MTTTRSFVRLAIAGFFANALAVACVVSDDGGGTDDSCTPGEPAACNCPGTTTKSTKECNASGTGYLLCECGGVGGAGNGGGTANSGAGEGGTKAYGGSDTGAGGDPAGGMTASGGAGGGENLPAACEVTAANDICEECYYGGCCVEWAACVDEADDLCVGQFLNILVCAQDFRTTRDVVPADLVKCGEDEVAGGASWSAGLSPLVKPLIDCVAGEPGWETKPWGAKACNNSCFKMQ